MIKKILFSLFALFFSVTANAAEMVNVEYIHQLIKKRWDVDLPYNPALTNPKVAANMKYLLTAVDRANEIINGQSITDHGSNEQYATMAAADTTATNDAVGRLVEDLTPKFFVTTTPDPGTFSFSLSAKGKFMVDWGDGSEPELIVRQDTNVATYSHPYPATPDKAYTIGIGGNPTLYINTVYKAAITFTPSASKVASVSGSLGKIFHILGEPEGTSWKNYDYVPQFYRVFYRCNNLKTVPDTLFSGVNGHASSYMFDSVFRESGIESLPEDLFNNAGITDIWGAGGMFNNAFNGCHNLQTLPARLFAFVPYPQPSFFAHTFEYCTSLKEVPPNFFATIKDKYPETGTFGATFANCTSLTTIPEGLFAGINAVKGNMFNATFSGCTSLTHIPPNLFGDKLSGGNCPSGAFTNMFNGCTSLTGPSVRINGKYLYDICSSSTNPGCYTNATDLDDWDTIPNEWK